MSKTTHVLQARVFFREQVTFCATSRSCPDKVTFCATSRSCTDKGRDKSPVPGHLCVSVFECDHLLTYLPHKTPDLLFVLFCYNKSGVDLNEISFFLLSNV